MVNPVDDLDHEFAPRRIIGGLVLTAVAGAVGVLAVTFSSEVPGVLVVVSILLAGTVAFILLKIPLTETDRNEIHARTAALRRTSMPLGFLSGAIGLGMMIALPEVGWFLILVVASVGLCVIGLRVLMAGIRSRRADSGTL